MVTADAGLLHRPGDAHHIADLLDGLLQHPEERAAWAERARRHAVARYGMERMAAAYEQLIMATVNHRRAHEAR